jgi:two-component system, sensor histidine kinase and response regulator
LRPAMTHLEPPTTPSRPWNPFPNPAIVLTENPDAVATELVAVRRSLVDLRALCEDVFDELTPAAARREVELDGIFFARTTFVDEDLVRRIVKNLLQNAIEHAPAETIVTVITTPRASSVEIRVIDQGAGGRVRLRGNADGSPAGTGGLEGHDPDHGLCFCRRAVEAHGGRIWLEDSGPGAVFCVSLPDVR